MSAKLINIVLDLETLSTAPNAAIIQIGACIPEFDRQFITQLPLPTFEFADATIRYEECLGMIRKGLVVQDDNTMIWWDSQPTHKEVFSGQMYYGEALAAFQYWINWIKVSSGADIAIWGNGSDFDNVVITHSMEVCNIPRPWSFRNNRCLRTIRALFPVEVSRHHDEVAHTALGDARYEARILNAIYNELNFDGEL